jgi:class 3 adenylate cyclase
MTICVVCGRDSGPDARFCAGCGAPLEAELQVLREERKVVTVLFADLVGFTSRAERLDPEDVRATLTPYYARLRVELERYGGTVEKFIGDAVMAVFGAPVAHEDDAERAVRAALSIRDAMSEDERGLEVRIGVNSGEALVTLGARPEEGEGMVAGDVVNTAARIQAAAPPNGILVGEQTRRATRTRIEYREAEPVLGKGKAEPIPVWEALQATGRFGVDAVQRPRVPLVGRERERRVLADALDRVREERSPQLITLVAAPGLGKSRLVHELFAVVEASPDLISWRQGRSLPYGEGVSYWALGEIVKAQAGILETDTEDETARKLHAAAEDPWIESHLGRLVGIGGDDSRDADRSQAFAAWRRFIESVAEARPLVLVFEDLHWADDGLLDFVDHLVDWADAAPLLVVGTARPELLERRPGWGGGKRNATTLSLSPLSDDETAQLLTALLERPVVPADLVGRAGGNPLFAEEFARLVAEGEGDEIPETLQGVIAARLDALAPEEKALVQNAAVVGKVFWLGALTALGSADEMRLHALARKEFVRRERRSSVEGDTEFAFLHVLIRDVAYAQIPRAGRAERHLAVARWIEEVGRAEDAAEMLTHHYLAAREYAPGSFTGEVAERARRAFGDAGARALSLSSYEAAERFTTAALELTEHGTPDWSRLYVQRVRAVWGTRTVSGREFFEQAQAELEASGYAEEAAEVAAVASWSAWITGDHAAAQAAIRHAAELVDAAPPSRAKATVLSGLARLLAMAGETGEPERVANEAIAMARELGLVAVEAEALNNRGVARWHGGDSRGIDDMLRSVELARAAGSMVDVVRGLGNLASFLEAAGDLRRADEAAAEGLAEAERAAVEGAILWLRTHRIEYGYYTGRWDDAVAAADAWLAERAGRSRHFLEGPVRGRRALLLVSRGDVAAALAEDELQVELAQGQDPQVLDQALATSALVRVLAGDLGTAGRRFDDVLRRWREAPNATTFSVAALAAAAVLLGRCDEFLAAAAGARRTRWLDAAAALARGEWLDAAEAFDAIGTAPDAAFARLQAPQTRDAALAFYRSVGAKLFVRRGEELLAAAG